MRSSFFIALVAVLGGAPAAAMSKEPAREGAETHDGFYFRMNLGIGRLYTSDSADEVDLSGGSGVFAIAIGGAFAPNFVFFVEAFRDASPAPTGKGDGRGQGVSMYDTATTMSGVGPGIAYFIEPENVSLSATLFASKLGVQSLGAVNGTTDFGYGLGFMAGKEWWVSEEWGLGFAVRFGLASAAGGGRKWAAVGVTAAVSATFN